MIVAIDVGTQNMALCALRRPAPDDEPRTLLLTEAKRRLRSMELVRWELASLHLAKKASLPQRAAAVATFVDERRDLFLEASVVVIETQMRGVMRTVAACLFACVRLLAGDAALMISQQGKTKLCWSDLKEICSDATTSYPSRKSAAVECAYFLLGLRARGSEVEAVEEAPANIEAMRAVLLAPGKKDDLADALLHLCAYDCRGAKRRVKRKDAEARRAMAAPGQLAGRGGGKRRAAGGRPQGSAPGIPAARAVARREGRRRVFET